MALTNILNEFFKTETTFLKNMQILQRSLTTWEKDPNHSAAETVLVTRYKKNVQKLLMLHEKLNLASPVEVSELNKKIHSDIFLEYVETLGNLAIDQRNIDTLPSNEQLNAIISIDPENTQGSIGSFTINPPQRLMRYGLLCNEIHKQAKGSEYESVSKEMAEYAVQLAKDVNNNNAEKLDASAGAFLAKQYLHTTQTGANSFFLHDLNKIESSQQPGYIGQILVQAYPNLFSKHKETGAICGATKEIDNALGLNPQAFIVDMVDNRALEESGRYFLETNTIVDPSKFDSEKLDVLYEKDHNAVWLALKSAQPISETFKPEDKIKAFVDLAQAYKNGDLGKKGKYEAILNLQESVTKILEEHPNNPAALKAAKPFLENGKFDKLLASEMNSREMKANIMHIVKKVVRKEAEEHDPNFLKFNALKTRMHNMANPDQKSGPPPKDMEDSPPSP